VGLSISVSVDIWTQTLMFSNVFVAGVFNILCLHDNHIGRGMLLAGSRAVVVLYSQYLCLGPVCVADRYLCTTDQCRVVFHIAYSCDFVFAELVLEGRKPQYV